MRVINHLQLFLVCIPYFEYCSFCAPTWVGTCNIVCTLVRSSFMWDGWGVDHTGQFWHHMSASLDIIVWKAVDQCLCLNRIPNNFMVRTIRNFWCDQLGMRENYVHNLSLSWRLKHNETFSYACANPRKSLQFYVSLIICWLLNA